MADNDSRGQFAVMLALLQSETWRDFWEKLNFSVETFESVGLGSSDPDAVVWQSCQDRQIILITSNRNAEGPDSLEATIRARNDANSLPVITIADPRRLMQSKAYAEQVVERLLEYLLELDNQLGTGRIYVP